MKRIIFTIAALVLVVAVNAQTTVSYAKHPKQKKSKIKVTTSDNPRAPYEGKPSKTNDGVDVNKVRNINYQNNGVRLPSSDGKMR